MCSKLSLRGNAIGLLVAVIAAILFPYWVGDSLLGYTNSLWPIVMLVGVIVLWRYVSRLTPSRREEKNAWIFASLLSLMTSFGYHLNNDFIPFDSIGLWLALVCFTVVIKQLLIAFWHWLSLTEIVLDRQPKGLRWLNSLLDRPLLVWCFIVLCWVPAYLSIFPGGFVYDAAKDLNQTFTGYIGDLPYLHSAIITTLLPWSKSVTGEYTLGIAIYVVAQMVVMGAMFAQIVTKFYRRGFNAWVVLGMTVYYALFPVIAMTVTQTVRDVLFAALLNYSFFLLYLLAVEKKYIFSSWYKPIGIGIVLALTLLARNNNGGYIILVIFVVALSIIWYRYRPMYQRGATILWCASIGTYLVLSLGLKAYCQPNCGPGNPKAMLSLMTQAIARAYEYDNDWTEAERDEFAIYFNVDSMHYAPACADKTKGVLSYPTEGNRLTHVGRFLSLWLKTGMNHKARYVEGVMATNRYMWFPPSYIDGYMQVGECQPFTKCYSVFNRYSEVPVSSYPMLDGVMEFYERIGLYPSFERVPLVSMLFSIGFMFWVLLNSVFVASNKRFKRLYLPLGLAVLYMLISSFVPLIILRYFVAIFYMAPMIVAFSLQPGVAERADAGKLGGE